MKKDFTLNTYLVYSKNILMLKIKHRANVIIKKGVLHLQKNNPTSLFSWKKGIVENLITGND